MSHSDKKIEVDEYNETMYALMKEGWFISKVTENKKEWRFVLSDKEKATRKVIVTKPVSSNKE